MADANLPPWTGMQWFRIEEAAHIARRCWANYRADPGRIGERRRAMEEAAMLRCEANRILASGVEGRTK